MNCYRRYAIDKKGEAVTNNNLDYAIDAAGFLNLDAVLSEHKENLPIYRDPHAANVYCLIQNNRELPASHRELDDDFFYHSTYCITIDDAIYINDGHYKPLNEFLGEATEDELSFVIPLVAIQAALFHSLLFPAGSAEGKDYACVIRSKTIRINTETKSQQRSLHEYIRDASVEQKKDLLLILAKQAVDLADKYRLMTEAKPE